MITIRDLRFKWKGHGRNLLEIDCLSVPKGERLFIKGSSGSGKSSFLSLLAGITLPQSGSIEILDQTINTLKPSERDEFRADHIGYIFQMFNLVPYLSVIDNVTLPCHFSRARKQRVAETGRGIDDEAARLLGELGLSGSEITNKPVTELSVGQQQRVAACRSLIGSPEILIADEPTSSLDADAQTAFVELLSRECKQNDITLLFVSHDTRLMYLFDRTASLEDGKITFEENHADGRAA